MNDQIIRRKTYNVKVGKITIGSDFPIVVQSMTNTDTEDFLATLKQIIELYLAGSEIVRVTVNTIEAAKQIVAIKKELITLGYNVPIVGDFHFNGHKILQEVPQCAEYLDKYRINPGNVGRGLKRDEQFSFMIRQAIAHNKAVRIGVNWGSLDQDLLKQMLDLNQKRDVVLSLDEVMQQAIQAGATEINPATDYDYGYRQGMFKDPFGHYWQIQKKI